MKELSKKKLIVIERIYEDYIECQVDVKSMLDDGYKEVWSFHSVYPHYRKFEKEVIS